LITFQNSSKKDPNILVKLKALNFSIFRVKGIVEAETDRPIRTIKTIEDISLIGLFSITNLEFSCVV
jgi:hypothetical protein